MKKKKIKKKNNNNRNKIKRKRETESDVKEKLVNLEDEYRKASISEKDYKELKEKYSKRLNKMNNMAKKDSKKEEKKKDTLEVGEIEEVTPEVIEKLATQLSQQPGTEEETEATKKKSGFFSRLFGGKKKEQLKEVEDAGIQETSAPPAFEDPVEEPQRLREPSEVYQTPQPSPRFSQLDKKVALFEVEVEKLKTMLETVKETGHVTEETIQTISESIGELRSLIFQTDASLKETMIKLEKIEDDISEVKPKEIIKRFRGFDAKIEKHGLEIEKLQKKSESANEKLNKMYEMLKSIEGIENLVHVNKKIQEKLKDVDEAVKYIGRIGAKTERQFMDLSRGLEDLVLFKAKQEDLDESLRDIVKSIDGLNVKFETYVSKKDLGVFREDILLIKKQLENVSKVLPLVEVKLPENIVDLRKEREDILLILDSLREQYEEKKITKAEYKNFKEGNEKRLKEIEKELEKEWKKVEKIIKRGGKETPTVQPTEQPKEVELEEEKPSQLENEKKLEVEEESEKKKLDKKSEIVKEKIEEEKEVFEKKEVPETKIETKEVVEAKPEEKIKEEAPEKEVEKIEIPKKDFRKKKREKRKEVAKKKPKFKKKVKKKKRKLKILDEIKKM
ncbi:MAG: hypothetical protein GTN36_04455 [Candidatus Aenigmarchaeota archaeon]|nr:hypothetical protein [Candidatus Aenigmarchaeota archaeon]